MHSGPWLDPKNWHDFYEQKAFEQEHIVGFKIMYNSLNRLSWLRKHICDQEFYIIHLLRENLLENYVSHVRLKQTGQSSVSDPCKINRNAVYVDVVQMKKEFEKIEDERSKYRKYFKKNPFFECSYEGFMGDRIGLQSSVLSFLGADNVLLKMPTMKKISKGDLSGEIVNYSEVLDALSGTPYERWV
jgi:LPS sulfotransferase NodH